MNYNYKGYTLLNESKKAHNIQVVFLSSRAEKTKKSSNSMFFFEDAAKKAGLKLLTIDPSSSIISKASGDDYNVVEESGDSKKTFVINPTNTIIVPRRTVLKNIESRDFLTELQNDGFFVLNNLDAIDNCEDKFITYKKLKAYGVPTPKTSVITISSMNKLQEKVDAIGGNFPIIIKITKGTQGVGVGQIDSMISLKSVLQAIFALAPKADILLQEKINSDYDLRIHVLYKGFERMTPGIDGYEIIGCMKRNQLEGDFRSNYSLGSTAEKGHLTPDQEKIAKMAAKATGCRWCGVDLIMDSRTKTSYVIEVNSSPGTKGITTAAGDDVVGTLMDMFKDFKYTKYDSDQIGRYETATIKDLGEGIDVPVYFNDSKSFTELECSSVNAGDDEVSFVYDGATYKKELSGIRKGEPMVEMNIRFNGTIYKNEMVVLKQVNGGSSKLLIAGTKLLHRISDKSLIVDDSFILTDNTTGFEPPVNESMLCESHNWLFGIDDEEIRLGGLKNIMETFIAGSRNEYKRKMWSISGNESKDNWVLSFNGKPIIECDEGSPTFKHTYMPYKKACKIAGVIESILDKEVDMTVYKK